eukprot:6433350-Prymnesium_polylepis.1
MRLTLQVTASDRRCHCSLLCEPCLCSVLPVVAIVWARLKLHGNILAIARAQSHLLRRVCSPVP